MWRVYKALLGLLGVCSCSGSPCRTVSDLEFEHGSTPLYPDTITETHRPLAIIGDTQRTSFFECAIGREVNDREQSALVGSLASEHPGALVLLGDMVYRGSSDEHWQYFDYLMQPILREMIPVLPILGNHDYSGSLIRARTNAAARFPLLRAGTHYRSTYGRLGLVLLDSNHRELGAAWLAQTHWLRQVLEAFDQDPAISGVLVFAHHPPFTRSSLIAGDPKVRAEIVPEILRSRKTLALFSGHAHGFERYERKGKHFIVSGGGGGPRPGKLRAMADDDLLDRCVAPEPRPLNYLLIEEHLHGVEIRVRAFDNEKSAVCDLETINIDFPTSERADRAGL